MSSQDNASRNACCHAGKPGNAPISNENRRWTAWRLAVAALTSRRSLFGRGGTAGGVWLAIFSERGLSSIRSAWKARDASEQTPPRQVWRSRCELGQLALRSQEDAAKPKAGWTPPGVSNRVEHCNRMDCKIAVCSLSGIIAHHEAFTHSLPHRSRHCRSRRRLSSVG